MLNNALVVLLFLFHFILKIDSSIWDTSSHLNEWLTDFDRCIISSTETNKDIDAHVNYCKYTHPSHNKPIRCQLGNTWPSRSGFCSSADISYSSRQYMTSSLLGYDNPRTTPIKDFFIKLNSDKTLLLLIGDSVMQQFFGAVACELEREGIWNDPTSFRNTGTPNIRERNLLVLIIY